MTHRTPRPRGTQPETTTEPRLELTGDRGGLPAEGHDESAARIDESGKAKDDPSRAPESGTP
jgi:hypothetical protein